MVFDAQLIAGCWTNDADKKQLKKAPARTNPAQKPLTTINRKRGRATDEKQADTDLKSGADPKRSRTLVSAIQIIASAYAAFSVSKHQKAADWLALLPARQGNTAFVMVISARALFEQSKYNEACDVFKRIRYFV